MGSTRIARVWVWVMIVGTAGIPAERRTCRGRMLVRVPAPEAEAQRHMARDRRELQKEIRQHRDRIRKLLCAVWGGAASDESLPNGWRHDPATAVKAGESRPQQIGRSASADTAG